MQDFASTSSPCVTRAGEVIYPLGLVQLANFRGATVQETLDYKACLCYYEREP